MVTLNNYKNRENKRFFIFGYWYDSRWTHFVGATVKIWDLSWNLASLGHEVVLFVPKLQFNRIDLPFRVIEVPILNLPMIRFLSFNIFLVVELIKLIGKEKPEIVYVRRMMSIVPLIYAKLTKSKYLYEINDDPYEKKHNEGSKFTFIIRSKLSTIIDEINLKYCDMANVITREILNKISINTPNVSTQKLIIIPSGANTEIFRPLDRHSCCSQLGLDPNFNYIGFIGSLLEHQGVDVLMHSFHEILKRFSNCRLLILGEGPMKLDLQNYAKINNLENKVIFTGEVPYKRVPEWIGTMTVCVAPFKNSAGLRSPVKIFEYLSCGQPVVASKISGTTDIFENCAAVKMVEPENTAELADAIVGLLTNTKRANTIGKFGRKFILENFSRKEQTKKLVDNVKIVTNLS